MKKFLSIILALSIIVAFVGVLTCFANIKEVQVEEVNEICPELTFNEGMAIKDADHARLFKWLEDSLKSCENSLEKSNKIYEIYEPLLNAINEKWRECVVKGLCSTDDEKPEDIFKTAMNMYMEMKKQEKL